MMAVVDMASSRAGSWHPRIPEPGVCRQRVDSLSLAEWATIERLALGFTVKEVAEARGVKAKTLYFQLGTAYEKLYVQCMTQAVIIFRRAEQVA